jgi:putative inorganic carbon (HCO3(-)) transporter
MPLRAIVLLLFFIPSIPVCFFRPFYGVILWTVISFLNPQSYIWTSVNIIPWAQVVAIPTLLGLFVFTANWPGRLLRREVLLIVLLWVWFTITTVVSSSSPQLMHHAADSWYRWQLVSKILLMTVVMVAIIDTQ